MNKEQASKGLRLIISLLLVGVTILLVFNSSLGVLKWITNYSVQIMLGMLTLGFLFLIFAQERLMFTSLVCCSLLCLFLQRSSNNNLILPEYSAGGVLKIAHANMTNVTEDLDAAIAALVETDADLISLQEVSYPLNEKIHGLLQDKYPYRSAPLKKNDFWSLNVYSKSPIANLDTFYVGDLPNLQGEITLDNEELPINFVSTYMLPPFSDLLGNENFHDHLDLLASKRRSMTTPFVVFGDFNVAGWYDEIQDFREKAALMDSRRGYMPAVGSLFSYPVDHIFFSEQLKCVDFEVIQSVSADQFGIVGTYQINEVPLGDL